MQAIVTRYKGPTDRKQARIAASATAGACVVLWDWELDTEENHHTAAVVLAKNLGWGYGLVSGCLPNGDYCHVFTDLR